MTDEKAIEKMLYDQQQGWPLCPRCGERIFDPRNEKPFRATGHHSFAKELLISCDKQPVQLIHVRRHELVGFTH